MELCLAKPMVHSVHVGNQPVLPGFKVHFVKHILVPMLIYSYSLNHTIKYLKFYNYFENENVSLLLQIDFEQKINL